MSRLGERVRSARKKAGLTQQALADAAGLTKGAISMIENGRTESIKQNNLFNIAEVTSCSYRWLATGSGHPDETAPPPRVTVPEFSLSELKTAALFLETGEKPAGTPEMDPFGACSKRSAAIHISNDNYGTSFLEGLRVVIDPDEEPSDYDYALWKLELENGSEEYIFANIYQRLGAWEVVLNPAHPARTPNIKTATSLGRAIRCLMSRDL